MKKNKFFFFSFVALLGLITLFPISSCKNIVSPIEDIKLIIDYNVIKTSIDVHFYDANTGQMLGSNLGGTAYVNIAGRDQMAVVDALGVKLEDNRTTINRGIATMALQPTAAYTPSPSNLVAFTLVTDVPGYLRTTQQVIISDVGRQFVRVNMVALDAPPSGVTVGRDAGTTTTNGGRVEAPATVTLPNGRASLVIPEGVVLRDAGGTPLSGSIDVTLVHFDNADSAAIRSFPGGLTPTVVRSNGTTESGVFYSAGFDAIEIRDAGGRQAAQISDGTIKLVSQVSRQTYNPITRTSIAAGDIVTLWSLNENEGTWKEEGTAIAEEVDGNLQFTVQLSHLSYYNFDWLVGTMCNNGVPFVFNISGGTLPGPFLIKGDVYRQDDNTFINTILMWVENNEPVYTTYAPEGIPVKILWNTENSPFINVDALSQPTLVDNLCGTSPVNVYLNIAQQTGATTINIEISLYCASNPDVIIRPTYSGYCQNTTTGGPVIPISIVDGISSIPGIILGDNYYVWLYYEGTEHGDNVVITQNTYTLINYEIPPEACTEVFGSK